MEAYRSVVGSLIRIINILGHGIGKVGANSDSYRLNFSPLSVFEGGVSVRPVPGNLVTIAGHKLALTKRACVRMRATLNLGLIGLCKMC